MGIEANLLDIDVEQKQTLKAGLALHKQHRKLLHSGRPVRLNTPHGQSGFGVIAADGGEAIFSYAQLDTLSHSVGARLRFFGLDEDSRYKVNIIWPLKPKSYSTSILEVIDGSVISGDGLINVGMQLPIMVTGSLFIIHLQRRL
jgi:alpha-galactosidase